MKTRLGMVTLIFFLLLAGCRREAVDFNKPNVGLFVKQLKEGDYQTKGPSGFIEVPRFTKADIPELMKYVSDMTVIKYFPLPPNSANIHAGKFRLGECMMWIIESVREGENASDGCQLIRSFSHHGESVRLNEKEIKSVAVLYRNWWAVVQGNPQQIGAGVYSRSPLYNTKYIWN